ncbi:MAG: hypothetical protein ACLFR0_02770 [Alphaproteobacteria bacterium]
MKYLTLLTLSILGLSLAACGTSTKDRALSGGALGAGAGAATSTVTGGDILTGAAIGGAAGAATGAATDEDDINLDDTFDW